MWNSKANKNYQKQPKRTKINVPVKTRSNYLHYGTMIHVSIKTSTAELRMLVNAIWHVNSKEKFFKEQLGRRYLLQFFGLTFPTMQTTARVDIYSLWIPVFHFLVTDFHFPQLYSLNMFSWWKWSISRYSPWYSPFSLAQYMKTGGFFGCSSPLD